MPKPTSYKLLRAQLDELLAWFESGDIDVDEALVKYEEAIKVTKQLEKHLQSAENKLQELKAELPDV